MYRLVFLLFFIPCSLNAQILLRAELDTIHTAAGIIRFNASSKAEFQKVFAAKMDSAEKRNLVFSGGKVKRLRGQLIFTLKNGKKKILRDRAKEGDDYIASRLVGVLAAQEKWVVFNGYNESYDYVLIDFSTGRSTNIMGYPVVSPDGKHIVCGNVDLVAGFTINGIQVLNCDGAKVTDLFSRELNSWSASVFRWLDNSTIIAERVTLDAQMEPVRSWVRFRLK